MAGEELEKPHRPSPAGRPAMVTLKKSPANSSPKLPLPPQADIINVSKTGDLVLVVSSGIDAAAPIPYRVDSELLRQFSRYFSRLLHPDRFREGLAFREAMARLEDRQLDPSSLPAQMLPRVELNEMGLTSPGRGLESIFCDFFRVLHGTMGRKGQLSMSYLAKMAVLADRFDCIPRVAEHFSRSPNLLHKMELKDRGKAIYGGAEERVRQKILVGWYFSDWEWFKVCSRKLVLGGSIQWTEDERVKNSDEQGLWWDLPGGLEDELRYRRECILNTLNAMQLHLLKLYTSKRRQCKLGYDSSPQCDSFQLGEAVRFLTRIGTLRLQGQIFGPSEDGGDNESGAAAGRQSVRDVESLIATMKQAPSYQIDSNHRHCGIRTRLIPALEHMEALLPSVGLCLTCWVSDRNGYAWSPKEGSGEGEYRFLAPSSSSPAREGAPPVSVGKDSITVAAIPAAVVREARDERKSGSNCEGLAHHRLAWGLFTAEKPDWMPELLGT
ncbi:MAG: hypothetical protein M1840_000375 [Geoglossum simile]|nr:MAG: hypothetical protein M1840_000375 [Geoglossum simile]